MVLAEVVNYFEKEWQALTPEGAVGMVLKDLVSSSAYWPTRPAARLVLRMTVTAVVLRENAQNESLKVLAGAQARASVAAPAGVSASKAEKDWVADVMGQLCVGGGQLRQGVDPGHGG